MKKNVWKIIGIAAAIILLRVLVFSSFWPAVGVVGFIWAWSYLQTQFPTHKKLVSVGMIAILLVSVWRYVDTFIYPYTERTRAASERQWLFRDMWAAEKVDPPMLAATLAASRHLQLMEEQASASQITRLNRARTMAANRQISLEALGDSTRAILGDIEKWRSDVAAMSSGISGRRSAAVATQPQHQQQVVSVQIYSDKDIDIKAPHGARDVWIEPPGKLTYTFPGGKTVIVPAGHSLNFSLPSREFKLRGDAGTATVTWKF